MQPPLETDPLTKEVWFSFIKTGMYYGTQSGNPSLFIYYNNNKFRVIHKRSVSSSFLYNTIKPEGEPLVLEYIRKKRLFLLYPFTHPGAIIDIKEIQSIKNIFELESNEEEL